MNLRSLPFPLIPLAFLGFTLPGPAQNKPASAEISVPYLPLTTPRPILDQAQPWESDESPHSLSVIEWNREKFRYWGWYGLTSGRGIGLARSNDLLHWTKFNQNPVWPNAQWPSALAGANPHNKNQIYFAVTRDYDTPSSYIVLASSTDGLHLTEERVLVAKIEGQRNQDPNLFHDPQTDKFFLTFSRATDPGLALSAAPGHFEIVSKCARSIDDLGNSAERLLLKSSTPIAAPNLLYIPRGNRASTPPSDIYYLALAAANQVQIYWSDSADGKFFPAKNNPVLDDGHACLFQHIFNSRLYAFDCHLKSPGQSGQSPQWELEEVEAPLPVKIRP
jgi:hypothetical protein